MPLFRRRIQRFPKNVLMVLQENKEYTYYIISYYEMIFLLVQTKF